MNKMKCAVRGYRIEIPGKDGWQRFGRKCSLAEAVTICQALRNEGISYQLKLGGVLQEVWMATADEAPSTTTFGGGPPSPFADANGDGLGAAKSEGGTL